MGEMTDAEMRAFAERHGLELTPEQASRMRELATRVVKTGLAVRRMAEKSEEPGGGVRGAAAAARLGAAAGWTPSDATPALGPA